MRRKICFILLTLSFFVSQTFALTSQEESRLRELLGELREINRMDAKHLQELEQQLQESQEQLSLLSTQLEASSSQMREQQKSLQRWRVLSIVGLSAAAVTGIVSAGLIIWRSTD